MLNTEYDILKKNIIVPLFTLFKLQPFFGFNRANVTSDEIN